MHHSGYSTNVQANGRAFKSRSGNLSALTLIYYLCGSATTYGWDVKPRFSMCGTRNMDYKDPDSTEKENVWLPSHTYIQQTNNVYIHKVIGPVWMVTTEYTVDVDRLDNIRYTLLLPFRIIRCVDPGAHLQPQWSAHHFFSFSCVRICMSRQSQILFLSDVGIF